MSDRKRFAICAATALLALAALIWATIASPLARSDLGLIVIFGALIAFAMSYSIPIGGGHVSLMPMSTAAAYLIHGRLVAGWAVCLGMLGHALVRRWLGRHRPDSHEPTGRLLVEATITNMAMHAWGILAADAVYRRLGGPVPLVVLAPSVIGILILFAAIYLGVNHILIGSYLALRGLWRSYTRSMLEVLLYEAGPLLLTPLIAVIYTRLGIGYFALFALALCVSSLISHHLALTSQRLQRRVQELGSLQAVGEVLSRSLDLDTVVSAVYTQVARLVAATSFYIALYDPELDEVSFPIVIEDGRRMGAAARRARHGLTEYILETAQPLLLHHDVTAAAAALGIERIGKPSVCWLGIPIVAGDVPLGMFALQSYDRPDAYDASHLDILQAIAAQAAIAIQNAYLYERTDEALARRVQELNSVLRTTREGMLLLDTGFRVLAGNRALADFLDVAQMDLPRHPIDALREDGESLVSLIGTTLDQLRADSHRLRNREIDQIQDHVVLAPTKLHVERTMTPVRDSDGAISGWLLVFRDMTEELELARLREDLTHMLVHDLRSPLALVQGSLDMLSEAHEQQNTTHVEKLIAIASRSADQILTMIDQLLDIGRLERGQLALQREWVPVGDLLNDVYARYAPVAVANSIHFEVEPDGDLPCLHVDRSMATRVLSNLVDNAMKFTPDGGSVSIRVHRASPQATLRLAVRDTGPGIPEAAQSRLFQKFQQLPGISGRRRGTGLGLFFCKLAVEAHGGAIWVDSAVGQGSTFYLTLPLVPPAPASE